MILQGAPAGELRGDVQIPALAAVLPSRREVESSGECFLRAVLWLPHTGGAYYLSCHMLTTGFLLRHTLTSEENGSGS